MANSIMATRENVAFAFNLTFDNLSAVKKDDQIMGDLRLYFTYETNYSIVKELADSLTEAKIECLAQEKINQANVFYKCPPYIKIFSSSRDDFINLIVKKCQERIKNLGNPPAPGPKIEPVD